MAAPERPKVAVSPGRVIHDEGPDNVVQHPSEEQNQ